MKITHLGFALLFLAAGSARAVNYQPVGLGVNDTFAGFINGSDFPTGPQTFGSIPFNIPASGNTIWHSRIGSAMDPKVLDVSVNLFGVQEVHTLIGSWWGEKINGTYASVEFFGSDGAYAIFNLDGDDDIRDYNLNPTFTTLINGTTTVEVWNNSPRNQHLDKQLFQLPASFLDETLSSMKITDAGAENFQRIFVAGITAGVAPTQAPDGGSTAALFTLGVLALGFLRRTLRSPSSGSGL